MDSLSMAAPRHKLLLLVHETDGSVRKRLADYIHGLVSIPATSNRLLYHFIEITRNGAACL